MICSFDWIKQHSRVECTLYKNKRRNIIYQIYVTIFLRFVLAIYTYSKRFSIVKCHSFIINCHLITIKNHSKFFCLTKYYFNFKFNNFNTFKIINPRLPISNRNMQNDQNKQTLDNCHRKYSYIYIYFFFSFEYSIVINI